MKKCIYMHIFPNDKKYIGQTNNPELRWKNNGKMYQQKALKEAIEKYGWENIKHIIIEEDISESEINNKENYYIKKYETYKNEKGYNTIYNNKYYPKCEYNRVKTKTSEKKKYIKFGLEESYYKIIKEKADKYYMKVDDYIKLKIIEQISGIKIFELQ